MDKYQRSPMTACKAQARRAALVSALTALLSLSAPAAAVDLASLTFAHAPNNPSVEGWVNVSLDNAGNWSQVDTAVVPWRFSMEAVWNDPPQVTYLIAINIRPASLPAPPSDVCEGDLCSATFGNLGGFTEEDVVPELTSSGPKIATVTAPLGEIDIAPGIFQSVTGFCHTKRQNLLNSGTSLHEVLAEGFINDGTAMVATLLYAYTAGASQVEVPIPFKVRCKGDPNIAEQVAPQTNYQGSYATGFQLSEAALNITPGFLKGLCPLQVTGQAVVQGNGAGAFRYRLEFDNGKVSQWQDSALLPKAGGGYAKVLQIPIPLPLPAAHGGGGIVNQQPGSDYAVQQQPEEPIFPGGGPSTPKAVTGTQEADNVHKGAARLVVSKPDGSNKVASPFDSYHVVCDKPDSVIFSGPKALQMQPKPPQPTAAPVPMLRLQPQVPQPPQRLAPTQQLAPQRR